MATNWTESELQELYAEIARRSAVDPDFRFLALTDSASAIAKVTDRPLHLKQDIKFEDNSKNVIHIPLPDPVAELSELTEFDLESVAGGSITVPGPTWNR